MFALVMAGACDGGGGGGSDRPRAAAFDGAATLREASAAMARLKSVNVRMSTADKPPIMVQGADIKLLKSGDAEGTLTVAQSGQTVEMKIVALGESIYLDAGTGGWRKVSKTLAAAMYDPSAALDPDRGIAKLLASATGAKAEAEERIGGKDAYRVRATLAKDDLGRLVPGIGEDVAGQVWVGKADHRLLKVKGNVPSNGKGTVTIDFTEFDAPYKISAPK